MEQLESAVHGVVRVKGAGHPLGIAPVEEALARTGHHIESQKKTVVGLGREDLSGEQGAKEKFGVARDLVRDEFPGAVHEAAEFCLTGSRNCSQDQGHV